MPAATARRPEALEEANVSAMFQRNESVLAVQMSSVAQGRLLFVVKKEDKVF